MQSQYDLVNQQFGPVASAYATSSTHSDATALADLVAILELDGSEEVLDIATGAGNLALAVAVHASRVVALDITPAMLAQTADRARKLGLMNLEVIEAPAENLPFPNASFDVIMVRTAPHHFADIAASVSEMSRVVRPTGKVLIVDTTAPEDDALDAELNKLEKLRDPSHVRNYRPSEWREMLSKVGLEVIYERNATHALGKRLVFSDWTSRMQVSDENTAVLRAWFLEGSEGLRRLLDVIEAGSDFSFTLPEMTLLARPARQ